METVTGVRDLASKSGQEAALFGWVAKFRSSGKIAFLELRDGTGMVQVVIARNEVDDESWAAAADLSLESSVRVDGTVRQDDRAPGGYEITARRLEVVGSSDEYPIQPKEHGVDFLLNNRHLWLRHSRQVAIMRVRDEIVKAVRDFFYERDFVLVDSPILTGAIGESAGTL